MPAPNGSDVETVGGEAEEVDIRVDARRRFVTFSTVQLSSSQFSSIFAPGFLFAGRPATGAVLS